MIKIYELDMIGRISMARVRDASGFDWEYNVHREGRELDIVYPLGEERDAESGYGCRSFEHAIVLLHEMDYLD